MTTILLLAGLSTRMGRNKLLLPYKGKALFEHPLAIAARHSDNVVCVLGYEKEKVERILSSYDVTMKYNPDFEKGQRSSTIAGLEGICDDVAILPGDLPLLTDDDFEKGKKLLGRCGACRPVFGKIPGHPVFVSKEKTNGLRNDPRPFKEFLADVGCLTYHGSYGTVFDTDIPELYQALLDDKLTGGH